MRNRPTLEELVVVQDKFRLPLPIYVEKDWFVVKALAAIAGVDAGPFQLVFQGGTALSRAHRLIGRMSEDVDIKIVSAAEQPRAAYRKLREDVTTALLEAGFVFDPKNEDHRRVMYESEYVLFQLPYEPVAGTEEGGLRPGIQIEISAWPMRRAPETKPVSSFVAEAFGDRPELEAFLCAAPVETAAEKFVALTRRAGAELAGLRNGRDPTLVRHIYDLHLIARHVDQEDAAALVIDLLKDEAALRGDRYPAYKADPLAESLRTVAGIASDAQFASEYAAFTRRMVYGEQPSFEDAIASLRLFAERVRRSSA